MRCASYSRSLSATTSVPGGSSTASIWVYQASSSGWIARMPGIASSRARAARTRLWQRARTAGQPRSAWYAIAAGTARAAA